jgi:uncharacterized protein
MKQNLGHSRKKIHWLYPTLTLPLPRGGNQIFLASPLGKGGLRGVLQRVTSGRETALGVPNLIALVTGILFGLGLGLSQMVDRERVLGFLDVAGRWDPTLLFVLGGAVGVTVITFRFVLNMTQPILGGKFQVPTRQDIDRPLVLGAALFGVGWGIAGYCPGPGLTALTLGIWNPVLFVIALLAGSLTYRWYQTRAEQHPTQPASSEPQLPDKA